MYKRQIERAEKSLTRTTGSNTEAIELEKQNLKDVQDKFKTLLVVETNTIKNLNDRLKGLDKDVSDVLTAKKNFFNEEKAAKELKDGSKQETLGSTESEVTKEAEPNQIPNPEMAHRIISGVYSVGCLEESVDHPGTTVGTASTTVNMDNIEDVSQSISRYSSLFTQVLTLTVGINVALEAGDIIKCIFPQVSGEDDVDHEQSGLYIIKEISHFMSGNRSFTSMKVIRDTSGD